VLDDVYPAKVEAYFAYRESSLQEAELPGPGDGLAA
jgi:hypothetical protein